MDWRYAPGLFVTGTDTGCGKTEITLGLMRYFQDQGLRVLGMKPVASGSEPSAQGLRNQDALRLQAQGSSLQPYERINPYAFEPPVAPHLAANRAGRRRRRKRPSSWACTSSPVTKCPTAVGP